MFFRFNSSKQPRPYLRPPTLTEIVVNDFRPKCTPSHFDEVTLPSWCPNMYWTLNISKYLCCLIYRNRDLLIQCIIHQNIGNLVISKSTDMWNSFLINLKSIGLKLQKYRTANFFMNSSAFDSYSKHESQIHHCWFFEILQWPALERVTFTGVDMPL